MAVNKIRLKGHETFILRDGWLTKGLMAVAADPKVFSKNHGADALGVGTNMAKAIRYWLRESELTEEDTKEGVKLTDTGELIGQNDSTHTGRQHLVFTNHQGEKIERFYEDTEDDSTSYFLKNAILDALEEFGDSLETNQKVAVLVQTLEKLIQS